MVRFRDSYPERWGGWVPYSETFTMDGICRSMHRWATIDGYVWIGLGTNKRFYVSSDDLSYDVSPIALQVTLTNPFATTSGSPVVRVTDTARGILPGQIVIFSGGTAVGGITIAGEYVVTGYISDDTYTITHTSNASSTTTGGGSVTVQYVYSAGSADQVSGGGWGSGAWGDETWGGTAVAGNDQMGLWSQDNWGEDLIACAYDGPIFYWDATAPSNRLVAIRALPGADGNAPARARFVVVSHKDRHLLAFGVSEEFGGVTAAPMTVRWCSQENIYNWNEADETGTAGSLPLSRGSRFIAVCPTQSEIIAWSDTSLYSLQFVGAPDVYIANIISEGADIAGANAAVTFGTSVYWLGRSGFYVYDGRVQPIPSKVWDYVFRNLNWDQSNKVYCATSRAHDEVIWHYPSVNSMENDSYVSYSVLGGYWMVGSLNRTAWLDLNFQYNPLAASPDGKLYYHDVGMDDGSTNPPKPVNAWLESAPLELSSDGAFDKGDRFAFIRRVLPDVTFLGNDSVNSPTMQMTLKMMDKPGGGFKTSTSSQVYQTAILPVEEFTEEVDVRLRGRSITVRYESNSLGSQWRIGVPKFDIRTDGQR
jgi:hypothetical protein